MRIAAITLPLLIAAAGPATAEPLERLTEDGRYQLMEINDRVIRLDTETGGFDLCRLEDGDWACTVARDERLALEARIAALTRRVEALERAARTARPAGSPAAAAAPSGARAVVRPSAPTPAAPEPPVAIAANDAAAVPERDIPAADGQASGDPLILGEPTAPESAPRRMIRYITGLVPEIGW
ncbi:hypothetical protein EDC22_103142 [Tepidamorphus gemmatus]|uniref:Uncharacterized protein n=1 Tax=Tepidamorphus gemmatus TaxID=747076 RepID=A0A4R3MDU9_9HYPH|nr:hypothetical protein [Tepidamorphus gemmatus]TCT11830.1 hypothetical protein EDC22_103142 [Tepidamorphus gemmatus]